MPVKIGNSYVSEAAVEFAKNSSEVESLQQKFPDLKISAGTQPFSGQGHGNLTIAPNILRQMKNDPEKRVEYEALIYDMQRTKLNHDKNCVASGWMINRDGSCGAWSISKNDDGSTSRQKSKIDRARLAGRLPEDEKKSSTSKKTSKKISETSEDEKSSKKNSEGMITVGFNEGKRSRQLAAARNLNDMNSLMQLLLEDLDEIQDGLEHGYCDENELKKVKKMIERAEKKLAEVRNQSQNRSTEKDSDFSISVLF